MPLELVALEDRSVPANLVPAGQFNWLQAVPTGGLAELVWDGQTLAYRTRPLSGGSWAEEAITTDTTFAQPTYTTQDQVERAARAAQLLFTPDGTPHAFLLTTGFDTQAGRPADEIEHFERGPSGWALAETVSLAAAEPGGITFPADGLTAAVGPGGVFHLLAQRTVQPQTGGAVGQGQLLYATDKGGAWSAQLAAQPGDLSNDVQFVGERYRPRFLSIAADSQNFAHITYSTGFLAQDFGTVKSDLGYATNRTGSWVPEVVYTPPTGLGDAGLAASVAIGPGDQVAVASYFVARVATGSAASSQLLYSVRGAGGGWTTSVAVSAPDGYVAADGPNFTGFAPQLRFLGTTPVVTFSDDASQHLPVTFDNEMAGQIREARLLPTGWATGTVFRQTNPLVNEVDYPVSVEQNGVPVYAALQVTNSLDGNGNVTGSTFDLIDLTGPVDPLAPPGLPGGPPGAGVVAADAGGGPAVEVFNRDGSRAATFLAFAASFTGGVRVAVGDVNGDGTPDVIAGTGPGVPTEVRVFSGTDYSVLFDVRPFEASFTGGVYVAAGDLTGDGQADVVVTPDEGGGPRVEIYRGGDFTLAANFFGIDDPNFRGGARSAVGDVNHDGHPDLVVAAGFGGGPRMAVFNGTTVVGGTPARLFNDIFVFEQTLRNGVFVTAGDVDGDGFADLIVGGGPGGGPRVLILSSADLTAGHLAAPRVLGNFFAGDPNNRTGVRVAAEDFDGDNLADLITSPGTGDSVAAYLGKDIMPSGTPTLFRGFTPFGSFTGGVFVG